MYNYTFIFLTNVISHLLSSSPSAFAKSASGEYTNTLLFSLYHFMEWKSPHSALFTLQGRRTSSPALAFTSSRKDADAPGIDR